MVWYPIKNPEKLGLIRGWNQVTRDKILGKSMEVVFIAKRSISGLSNPFIVRYRNIDNFGRIAYEKSIPAENMGEALRFAASYRKR